MILRNATLEDCQWVFDCRNDPETRKNSFNSQVVNLEDHEKWFANSLSMLTRKIYIAEINKVPLGVVRLDLNNTSEARISINVDLLYRGKGYGSKLVKQIGVYAKEWRNELQLIIAEVKPYNTSSIKCFQNAGYEVISEDTEIIKFALRL